MLRKWNAFMTSRICRRSLLWMQVENQLLFVSNIEILFYSVVINSHVITFSKCFLFFNFMAQNKAYSYSEQRTMTSCLLYIKYISCLKYKLHIKAVKQMYILYVRISFGKKS